MRETLTKRRRLIGFVSALVALGSIAGAAYWTIHPRILLLGFPSMYRLLLAEASAETGIRYDSWSAEEVDNPRLESADFRSYQAVFVSARRSDPLPAPIKRALGEAAASGTRVLVIPQHHAARLGVGARDLSDQEEWLSGYWENGGAENMSRFFHAVAALYLHKDAPVEKPVPTPDDGYYHPEAPDLFASTENYLDWYHSSGRYREGAPRVLIDFADGWKLGMTKGTDAVIETFESRGVNTAAIFGTAMTGPFALEFQPDLIVSRKHGRWWLGEEGVDLLRTKLDVPVMRGLSLLFTGETFSQYRQTRAGIRGAGLAMGAIVPELDGAIEPTLIEGLEAEWYGRRFEAVEPERIDRLADRALQWIHLRQSENREKKIAIVYVAGIGKGRLTAAHLNMPRSLIRFLHAMKVDGYELRSLPRSEKDLLQEMLTKGRNISPTQIGELNELAKLEDITLLPVDEYTAWFQSLPEKLRTEVTETFGPPPGELMTIEREGKTYFLIPKLDFGNVILLPQPVRGAKMDAKLQHNDRVPPPHQYLAVYWWLREGWQADAILNYGTHGTHEFLPGRPLGQLADDWSDQVLGRLPNIYVYTMDNVGEALIAKRRGSAVTISHQIPPITAASLSQEDASVRTLYRLTERFLAQDPGVLKEELRSEIAESAHGMAFDADLDADWLKTLPTDREIEDLQLHIHLINDDKIPLGLHVHGEADGAEELAPLVTQMLDRSFVGDVARTEFGFEAERGQAYERARQRSVELVEATLSGGELPRPLRNRQSRIEQLKNAFAKTAVEILRTLHALDGGYIPPGGGGDPVRNPEALPTGRNLYGVNPAEIPTRAAWEVGVKLAKELLKAERERLGRWPRKIGFTVWNTEIIRQRGMDLAQILYLLGVKPVWDHREVVADVEAIPAAELGRPRIDVVIQAASLFRDTFPDRMELLDKAVRLAAKAGDGENYIAENSEEAEKDLKAMGLSAEDARLFAAARVFSNAPGGYGTGLVGGIERSGDYENTKGLSEAYLARTGAVYTQGAEWGRVVPGVYEQALQDTDAVALSRSTNVVSPLTLDHYFEYLGGMTMAVRDTTGNSPETYIVDVRDAARPGIQTLRETLTRDLRGKYWNPRWIRAQQEEGFSGAVEMAQAATNLFGWQVTKPEAVDEYVWDHIHSVYIEDSLDLNLPEWFDEHNPYAFQGVASVLLESARKGFWCPEEEERLSNLAAAYAGSVIGHGPSGDLRTVNNAAFQGFVCQALQSLDRPRAAELSSAYSEALAKSAGASEEETPMISGRKFVEESSGSAAEPLLVYSRGTVVAFLLLGAVFVAGVRRRRRGV